uniref:Uncharacterized protein n=1 Tax=Triticum urartu TaxID=4572 RepID=A0A8R7PN19_TRIUA
MPTSRGRRTPTPGREKRRFCAGFLLNWGFEEDGRGHDLGGGGSSRPHEEAVHGSKSRRGKARWCCAGGHRELQPSHLHAQACLRACEG